MCADTELFLYSVTWHTCMLSFVIVVFVCFVLFLSGVARFFSLFLELVFSINR